MKPKKADIAVLAVCAASLAGLAALLPRLPEQIPTHWNFMNEPDAWGPRWTILAMGALPLAVWLLMKAAPRIDPRREAYARHRRAYSIITTAICLALAPIAWISAAAALGWAVDVGILIRILIGVLFVVLGNFMGKFKPNFFIGIRTPWTLSDPDVWRRTHRRGALVFVIMGVCMLASIAVPHAALAAIVGIGPVPAGVVYLFLNSYLDYRKKEKAKGGS